ncbi:MAG TPA: putative glycoside hydrolase [Gaiellales bacterium]|nr:putative glycoside hydrolase [Gaiellales bacterium]
MRRFIAAAAAACALAAAVPAAFASSSTATSAGFADTTAGIHLWAPIHEPGGRFASQADAVAAARRYDLMTIRIGQLGSYTAAMRAANPKLRIYVYINGTYLYKANRSQVSPSILAHTSSGALIQSNNFGNYLGTPSNAGWIAYKQKECQSAIAATGADGCYMDMLGSAPTMPGYNTGLPVNPATGRVWTKAEWLGATATLAGKVSAYVGKPVLGNGFGNGPRYFDAAAPSKVLLTGAVGSTAEAWLKAPAASATSYETESQWKEEVDLLADDNSAGGVALTMTKTWGSGTTAQKEAYRLYALASFLLGNAGHSYFYFSAAPPDKATVDSPLYHLPLGSPTGPYTHTGGVYQRSFSNGRVVVNPSTATVRLALGAAYQTPSGASVSSLTLAPHTAQILTLG